MVFDYTKLDAYNVGVEFLVACEQIAVSLPRERYYMADQLRRAALSACLNTAEGAGEFAKREKRRLYRIARRSAIECCALIQCAQKLQLKLPSVTTDALRLGDRVIAMLSVLAKPASASASASASAKTGPAVAPSRS